MSDEQSNSISSNEIGFDIIKIFLVLVRSWKIILTFTFLGLILAYFSYNSSNKVYKISSLNISAFPHNSSISLILDKYLVVL